MCNLGEVLELEARQEESKRKNVEYVKKLMSKLKMSFKEAIVFLEIPEDEEKEIEKYFKS